MENNGTKLTAETLTEDLKAILLMALYINGDLEPELADDPESLIGCCTQIFSWETDVEARSGFQELVTAFVKARNLAARNKIVAVRDEDGDVCAVIEVAPDLSVDVIQRLVDNICKNGAETPGEVIDEIVSECDGYERVVESVYFELGSGGSIDELVAPDLMLDEE